MKPMLQVDNRLTAHPPTKLKKSEQERWDQEGVLLLKTYPGLGGEGPCYDLAS